MTNPKPPVPSDEALRRRFATDLLASQFSPIVSAAVRGYRARDAEVQLAQYSAQQRGETVAAQEKRIAELEAALSKARGKVANNRRPYCRDCRLDPIGHAGFHAEPLVDVTKKCRECMNLGSSHASDCSRRVPPRWPFPPEVVERATRACLYEDAADNVEAVLSVIADYLRSEEARERVALELHEFLQTGTSIYLTAYAVVSALLAGNRDRQ